MESLIISNITKPPLIFPTKMENSSEFSPKRTKTLIKKADPKRMDARLNYLCSDGRLTEAIIALDSIARVGSKVQSKTYINLLQSCIDSGAIHLGRALHARIGLVEDADLFVETKLVGMYAKCGCLNDARKVFDSMRQRSLYTWSAMIGACSREHLWREVLELFSSMLIDGVLPDDFLLPKVLQACGNCSDVELGKMIHSLVIRLGMVCYPRVTNSILAVYAKCGELGLARRFFESMEERDSVSWNSMILGYCQKGENEEAHRLLNEMQKEGIEPSLITWNILISGYNQLGQCELAIELLKKMEGLGIAADVFTWTSLISGLAQNGRRNQALDLFKDMLLSGVKPNGVTLVSAIAACASLRSLNMGMEIHSVSVKMGFADDLLVGNSLIDVYSKCGELEAARKVFDVIQEKDVYTWNSMIAGYCQAGYCGKAYELFMRMQYSEVRPNVITWNIMISGYMQNGDEDQAIDLFQRMEKDGKVKPNAASWNSLVAGYLQNGKKNKALGIFRQMQSFCVAPNSVTILSILPACANLIAAKKVKEIHGCVLRRRLESALSVTNSLIDTYAKSGNIAYSTTIFESMPTKDIITWNSLIGGYVLHGCSAPALDLFDRMRKLGFKPNRGTFLSLLLAHSLAGMVDEGMRVFSSITDEYHIIPALEHYSAMINLYGRLGRIAEAMQFIEYMPIEPDSSVWAALLTACRNHGNSDLLIQAGEHLLDLEPGNCMIQHLISQAYTLQGKSKDVPKLRKSDKDNALNKPLAQSWIEVKNVVHTFFTADKCKFYSDVLYPWIQSISRQASGHDCHCELYIEEEDPEETSGIHSEKLAIAFALISSSPVPRTLRIMKNKRICRDCHRTAKYISATYGCDIYLHDTTCLHCFKSGYCSCGDYW